MLLVLITNGIEIACVDYLPSVLFVFYLNLYESADFFSVQGISFVSICDCRRVVPIKFLNTR